MFTTSDSIDSELRLKEARRYMNDALDILDECGAPGVIGSYLDLAICRLEEVLGVDQSLPSAAAEAAQELGLMDIERGPVLVWDHS